MKKIGLKNQFGLSLIEVLIAIALLSFMMLGVLQFTQSSFDTSERVTREDAEALQIETAMSRLEWDFSQIYSPLYFDHIVRPDQMSENEAEVFAQIKLIYESNNRFKNPSYTNLPIPEFEAEDKSTLVFFTSSNRRKLQNAKQSNFAWVKYSLAPNDEEIDTEAIQKTTKEAKKSLMLIRQISNTDIYNPEEIEWDEVKQQILHRKINTLKFEFWNPQNFKWTENLRTIQNGNNILYALRVTIEFYNADNIEQTTVRVFRPLYPEFTPEDMYKFLNAVPENNGENNNNNNNNSNNNNTNNNNNNSNSDGNSLNDGNGENNESN